MRKMMLLSFVLLCVAAGPATRPAPKLKADAPADVRRLVDESEAARRELVRNGPAAIKEAIAKQREIERAPIVAGQFDRGPGVKFRSVEQRKAAAQAQAETVERIRADAEAAKSDPAFVVYPRAVRESLREGFIGRFREMKVKQVIDGGTAIVELYVFASKDSVDGDAQPVDLYLTHWPTKGMVDDAWVKPADMPTIWLDGTKQYATAAGGSRTILQGRPFEIGEFVAAP